MRKWFLALALIVLPLVFAAAALAAPPTTEVTVIVDSVTVDSDICADFGFDVTFVENGTFKTKTYLRQRGEHRQDHPHKLQCEIHLDRVGEWKDASHQLPTRFHHLRGRGHPGWTPQRVPRSRGRSRPPRRRAPHPRRRIRRCLVRGRPARASQWVGRRLLRLLRVIRQQDLACREGASRVVSLPRHVQ